MSRCPGRLRSLVVCAALLFAAGCAGVTGSAEPDLLQALPEPLRTQFTEQFKTRLREAYPERDHGVVLPFRRIFVVARTKETTR